MELSASSLATVAKKYGVDAWQLRQTVAVLASYQFEGQSDEQYEADRAVYERVLQPTDGGGLNSEAEPGEPMGPDATSRQGQGE